MLLYTSNKIVANVSRDGVMEITAVDAAALKAVDWNKVINMPAYKLYIEVTSFPKQSDQTIHLMCIPYI